MGAVVEMIVWPAFSILPPKGVMTPSRNLHGRPFPHSHQRPHETITEIAWSAFSTLPPKAVMRPSQKLHGRPFPHSHQKASRHRHKLHGRPFPHSHKRPHETITEIAWSAFSTLPPEALMTPSQKLHGRCDFWTPKSQPRRVLCVYASR